MKENCSYKININGHYNEFNSEEELNSFLRANKRSMVASLLSDRVMFSNDRSKQQQIYQELKGISTEVEFEPELHRYFVGTDEEGKPVEYTPVTKLITQGRERLGYHMVTPFNMEDWQKNTIQSLTSQLDENHNPKYTNEQAQQLTESLKASWQVQSLLGTSWHNIAQAFFEGKIQSEKDIVEQFPDLAKVSNYVLSKYVKSLTDFRDTLYRRHPNALFLTETSLFDKESKVAGTADLIVVDENGKLHIYDYKTSVKSDLDWNKNKNETHRYQLAFYRQMLRRKGYDVETTSIVPIELREVDYKDKAILDFDMGTISNKYFKEIEQLMQNVKTIMPYTTQTKAEQITDNTDIHQFMMEAFNYEQKKVSRGSQSVDDEYERMISSQRYADAKKWYYYPFNANNTKHEWSKNLSEQQIKEKISQILQDVDNDNSRLPDLVSNFVKDAKGVIDQGGSIADVNWGGWSRDGNTNIKVRNLLYKYIMDPSWHIIQSDSMSDLNIIGFENTATNELDFITLTGENLNKAPQLVIPGAKSILGNFMNDNKAAQLSITKEATNGDVELLKIYSFIKNNKSSFVDKKIGSLFAVNLLEGNKIPHIDTQTLETLEKWHRALSKQMNPQLNLGDTNWEPQQIDKTRAFISYISDLLESKDWKAKTTGANEVKGLVAKYNNTSYDDVEERIQVLGAISNKLIQSIGGKVDTITQSSENNDTGLLIKLANEAILQLKKIPTQIEPDLKQWGFILDENASTTSPKSFRNLAQANLVQVVTDTMNNTRTAFLNYVNEDRGLRDIHDKFYSKMSSVMQIKALGYNLDLFDKLLEHNDEKPMMRFKDPNDASHKLSEPQKQYINDFLRTVNTVRVKKMADRGKSEQDIENFLASAEARNIPLLKASALTAFKGKNFKQFTDDFFRDLLNPGNIFKNDAESAERIDRQNKMFNAFDMYDLDLQRRAERIDNSPEGEFETDLELVLATYMMAHHKEQEVNKKLPLINAIKTSVMMNEIYGFNPTPNLVKLQNDYIATTIFGKNMLSGESEKVAKLTKGVQAATSAAMMWFNPLTGTTEMVSGLFGNVVRLMANKYNNHSFGLSEYAKAHAVVAGTLNQNKTSYRNVGFCDAINEMYGLSEMDVQRAAHEVQTGSGGLAHFRSKYAYWFNTFPGYFNRLVLFTAQAIKDGAISVDATGHITKDSAYQMIDSHLVYNEKLDKRFSLYTSNKDVPEPKQTQAYKDQKALYLAIRQDLEAEPGGIKSDGTLAKAYSNRQRNSMKEFADEVHGSYDAENKTNFQKMAFGRIMMQFKGWITAKKNRWFTETNVNEIRGSFEVQHDSEGRPIAVWKGKVTEGITQSILAMYNELKENKFNVAKSWGNMNNTQKENFMFLLGDSLIFGVLSLIVSMFVHGHDAAGKPLLDKGSLEQKAIHALSNSSKDFFIGSTVSAVSGDKNPLALASWSTKVLGDSWGAMTGQNSPTTVLKNVALYRNVNALVGTGN